MNKKVSTLLTVALTLGGSLLSSSAFAQTFVNEMPKDGTSALYHVYVNSSGKATTASALLSPDSKEGFAVASTEANKANKKYQWYITRETTNGATVYKLKNAEGTEFPVVEYNGTKYSAFVQETSVGYEDELAFVDYGKNNPTYVGFARTGENSAEFKAVGVASHNDSWNYLLQEVADETITASDLNDVNRGSFSLNYQFDKDHKATVNPFDKEIKAFSKAGADNVIYLATSWPSSANDKSILSDTEFEKCTFIVATSLKYDDWNISEFAGNGESSKFTEVKGNRLVSVSLADDEGKKTALKDLTTNAKYAIDNAQFKVIKYAGTEEYQFGMAKVYGLNKDKTAVTESGELIIALVDDQQGRLVTTVANGTEEEANEIEFGATITNKRTVTADKFLSTEKASVFNIKFVSKQIADDATMSEYNKYLTLTSNDGMIAHGSDFTNLNAPESQWIVVDATDNIYTFQNRENEDVKFSVELISTDKAGVYELRDTEEDELDNTFTYFYVDKKSGAYTVGSSSDFTGKIVELQAVTPVAESGYVTTELDNAGLLRMVFNATSNSSVHVSELYVTAKQEDEDGDPEKVGLSKEESDAAQFSVVKFDAASTATALSDTLYAYNNYVIWDAANKKQKTIANGDKVAVVTYAFKQLRADGENYYLSENMQTVEHQDDLDLVPRFVVKSNKNGSCSLIPVNGGDEFREVVKKNAVTFDASISTSASISTNETIYYDYTNAGRKFDFNILKETPGTSFNHVPQHVTMEAVNGGYVAMNAENNNGIIAPVSTLKADYTKEDLTFWLDTTDSEAVTPSFMISKAGNYMYNATDSLNAYNDGTASDEKVKDFALNVNGNDEARVIFQSADLTKVEDIENYKFQIVQSPESEDEYIIKSLNGYTYVAAHNQQLYISTQADAALRLTVTRVEAPTSNESVSASEVAVVAQNGSVVVKNAAGKNVVVSTILGQVVANEVLTSDNATINVPAGIVVVAVEGESFKINVR